MCLGIPMTVVGVDGLPAHREAEGVKREACLCMLQGEPVEPGN